MHTGTEDTRALVLHFANRMSEFLCLVDHDRAVGLARRKRQTAPKKPWDVKCVSSRHEV